MARTPARMPCSSALFHRIVASNRRAATPARLPGGFEDRARTFAAANPGDGAVVLGALDRHPRFHRGGWIMRLQPRAAAMTLDADVFLSRDLTARRYVHELVHVHQFGRLGAARFLATYFGGAARTLVRRVLRREALDVMTASPLEAEAYALDRRFTAWEAAQA